MEEMTRRELAFCYIYSQEIQKQNSKAQVKIFLDSLEIENNRDREYVKDSAQAIKEHNEEISKLIEENLKTGWTIDRISTVDLSLLKLAIYEINYLKTPYKIINFILCCTITKMVKRILDLLLMEYLLVLFQKVIFNKNNMR